ncbi:MAG: hypothetical protein KH378_02685 [Butyrivibrio sp.]|nr:hypothetical protein [Butyrivibrio sp.]
MKIHIIGCSGSGKTYLANALSKKYNISHFDGKRETLKSVYNLLKWTETFQNKNLKEIRSILDRKMNTLKG